MRSRTHARGRTRTHARSRTSRTTSMRAGALSTRNQAHSRTRGVHAPIVRVGSGMKVLPLSSWFLSRVASHVAYSCRTTTFHSDTTKRGRSASYTKRGTYNAVAHERKLLSKGFLFDHLAVENFLLPGSERKVANGALQRGRVIV